MRQIPLSKPNIFALIDELDYERVGLFKWHVRATKWTEYAQAHFLRNGIDSTIQLHRFVLQIDDPKIFVDHKNHNGLDCRRENLRICTSSQNGANARKAPGTISRFKGVTWHKPSQKWAAQIILNRQRTWIGVFSTEEEAAMAYLRLAKEKFGEFAHFPDDQLALVANG